jgi:pimeloyl-ACP methyl ester carboxylesterase
MSHIELDGRRLELLEIAGHGPPLVLLHQGLGSVGLWRDFPERLHAATGARVIAFSRLGHGDSDPPPRPRTPTFMREEALEVLPKVLLLVDARDPVLVGHSDGATIALVYAAHHKPLGAVAIAPHVFVEDICIAGIRQVKTAYETTDMRERMARHHRDPDVTFHGWSDVWLDPSFREWNIFSELERITAPLLLMQGERDQFATFAQLDEIEQRARGRISRVHLDGRHAPHEEQPVETVNVIARWLTDLRCGGIAPPPTARRSP